jgi:hypothetical protein
MTIIVISYISWPVPITKLQLFVPVVFRYYYQIFYPLLLDSFNFVLLTSVTPSSSTSSLGLWSIITLPTTLLTEPYFFFFLLSPILLFIPSVNIKYPIAHTRMSVTILWYFSNPHIVIIIIFPSFLSALQLRVSFGLLNNLPPFFILHLSSPSLHFHFNPSEADYLVSEQFNFYGVRLLA